MQVHLKIMILRCGLKKMAYLRFEWTPHLNEKNPSNLGHCSLTNLLLEVSFLEPGMPPAQCMHACMHAVDISQGHMLQWLSRRRLLCR